eukprot:3793452-Amphidinium_carterae.2
MHGVLYIHTTLSPGLCLWRQTTAVVLPDENDHMNAEMGKLASSCWMQVTKLDMHVVPHLPGRP